MDFDMIVFIDLIMFFEEFYGNGDGIVRIGLFVYWRILIGILIIRNIGLGKLFN